MVTDITNDVITGIISGTFAYDEETPEIEDGEDSIHEDEISGEICEEVVFEDIPEETSEEAPLEEATAVSDVSHAELLEELETLRRRVEIAERTAREISGGWRELVELYPDADISDMPDSFNEAIENGIPPAAAYALEMRRRALTRERIEAATLRSRQASAGRIREAEDSLYSPDEVRAMSSDEVRRNYDKIRRSMKSWR